MLEPGKNSSQMESISDTTMEASHSADRQKDGDRSETVTVVSDVNTSSTTLSVSGISAHPEFKECFNKPPL